MDKYLNNSYLPDDSEVWYTDLTFDIDSITGELSNGSWGKLEKSEERKKRLLLEEREKKIKRILNDK